MTINAEKIQEIASNEVKELIEAFSSDQEEIIKVLQFHLHAEQLLERILLAKLERGDKLIEHAGLSFHQKLCIVEAFNILDPRYTDALRKVNKLRNNCAHIKAAKISKADIDLIGRCLGKTYSSILKDNSAHAHILPVLLLCVLIKIGEHLIIKAIYHEQV
ncbi:hypothetical protein SAMN05216206_3551 [Pseudomonas guineae]|uniref:Mannitol repressor n=1 Tax=Pseudomonas guineae TaxID=425504 RepID=A0A1I3P208_9PSED|nr:hypothetical protein [Pseudomonas guineae]SFJ15402.1 hypothetical protein SAMN05216206_3551 [Pseudomonas guineae]